MSVNVTPHLNFRGDARTALDFYQSVFGGEITVFTYQDAHNVQDPAEAEQIMWGQVQADNGFRIMAYDVPSTTSYDQGDKSHFVSVRGDGNDEITSLWNKLTDGSTVLQELAPAGWAPLYGMLQDRFGVTWVLDVTAPYTQA
jgi:PhnB protein